MSAMIARLASLAVVLGCVGVALAQSEQPGVIEDGRFHSQYDRMPSGGDFARNYPRAAIHAGTPGVVQLCCSVIADRTLDCRVGFEWPQNQGFGEAAVNISKAFRLNPESYARYRAEQDPWLQVPISFVAEPAPRELPQIRRQIAEGTRGLCRPASVRTPQATEIPGMPEN